MNNLRTRQDLWVIKSISFRGHPNITLSSFAVGECVLIFLEGHFCLQIKFLTVAASLELKALCHSSGSLFLGVWSIHGLFPNHDSVTRSLTESCAVVVETIWGVKSTLWQYLTPYLALFLEVIHTVSREVCGTARLFSLRVCEGDLLAVFSCKFCFQEQQSRLVDLRALAQAAGRRGQFALAVECDHACTTGQILSGKRKPRLCAVKKRFTLQRRPAERHKHTFPVSQWPKR